MKARHALVLSAAIFIAGCATSPHSKSAAEAASTGSERGAASVRDCEQCPALVVIPAGTFIMGSPANEPGRYDEEGHNEGFISIGWRWGNSMSLVGSGLRSRRRLIARQSVAARGAVCPVRVRWNPTPRPRGRRLASYKMTRIRWFALPGRTHKTMCAG